MEDGSKNSVYLIMTVNLLTMSSIINNNIVKLCKVLGLSYQKPHKSL